MSKAQDEYLTTPTEAPIGRGNFLTEIATPVPPADHILTILLEDPPQQHQDMLAAFGEEGEEEEESGEADSNATVDTPRPVAEITYRYVYHAPLNTTEDDEFDTQANTTIRQYILPPPSVINLRIHIPPEFFGAIRVPHAPIVMSGESFDCSDHSA